MLRVVVLIAAFVFFREVRPRRSRWSPGAVTPYRSSIDRTPAMEELGLELNKLSLYNSWPARQHQ